jgi:hypothetical protein
MLDVTLGGRIGALFGEGRVSARALGLVRGRLVIAGAIRLFGGAVMARGALVMVCGSAVMFR